MSTTPVPQSKAAATFILAIQDAENLLTHFDKLNSQPPPAANEVLKRAGLIMAMTAWETYVEDRVEEAASVRLEPLPDRAIANLVSAKLEQEINRLHNPNSEKTMQLFRDYAGVELADRWHWNNMQATAACKQLNDYIRLRGDVVHRSRITEAGPPKAHPVTRDDLRKAINFLKELVKATERALHHATARGT